MPRTALAGTRMREYRISRGLKQGELARLVGISPSYLNLIEHNRRRIGGKLIHAIARELDVPPQALTEGAQASLVDGLREAALGHHAAQDASDQIEDLAERFPIWAGLMIDMSRRAADLERMVELLSDRMTHDPFLSTSVHEVLSTVTAIRSTASILVETPDIDAEWRQRFHRNLGEDAARLADSAESLVRYLDKAADSEELASTPMEEVDLWLRSQGYHCAALEPKEAPAPADLTQTAEGLGSQAARALATTYLTRYRADALAMPLRAFTAAVQKVGCDPARLARQFEVDLAAVFRRLASLPNAVLRGDIGLVSCDGSGTLTLRKPIPGFDLPRHSAACPLWPLYEALAHPMTPVRRNVDTGGRAAARFVTFAICQPQQATEFNTPPILEATMLIVPQDLVPSTVADPAHMVGVSCRICSRGACPARREPSLIGETETVGGR